MTVVDDTPFALDFSPSKVSVSILEVLSRSLFSKGRSEISSKTTRIPLMYFSKTHKS